MLKFMSMTCYCPAFYLAFIYLSRKPSFELETYISRSTFTKCGAKSRLGSRSYRPILVNLIHDPFSEPISLFLPTTMIPGSRVVPGRYPAVGTDEIADRIRERRGARGLTDLDGALLHVPPIADGWNSLLGAVRTKGHLPGDVRELLVRSIANSGSGTILTSSLDSSCCRRKPRCLRMDTP